MRETLAALAAGEIGIKTAEARLRGYATTDAGRFDADRETRRGLPEGILAAGKTPGEVADLTETALRTTGRALVTRAGTDVLRTLDEGISERYPGATVETDGRSGTLVAHAARFDPPTADASITVVTGGTADVPAAREAAIVARETGAEVQLIHDVGVASLARALDQLETLRMADVLVVAAGREGALPTVIAGLVDVPVIGLPVSTGYGAGGNGYAALLGMLQSCTVLSVVNIDAGYVAGAQAGLIARQIGATAGEPNESRGGEPEPASETRFKD